MFKRIAAWFDTSEPPYIPGQYPEYDALMQRQGFTDNQTYLAHLLRLELRVANLEKKR